MLFARKTVIVLGLGVAGICGLAVSRVTSFVPAVTLIGVVLHALAVRERKVAQVKGVAA